VSARKNIRAEDARAAAGGLAVTPVSAAGGGGAKE